MTTRCQAAGGLNVEGLVAEEACCLSIDVLWPGQKHNRDGIGLNCPRCALAPEPRSMASDPELPQFSGSTPRLGDAGQFHTVPQSRSAHMTVPTQHPHEKVLHFVCGIKESIWVPAFARTTTARSPHRPRDRTPASRRTRASTRLIVRRNRGTINTRLWDRRRSELRP